MPTLRELLRPTPGGLPWLFAHEMRLAWRDIGGKSLWFIGITVAVVWLAAHALATFMLMAYVGAEAKGMLSKVSQVLTLSGGIGFWFYLTIALSQSISHAVMALFSRGDMDLLLSSPIDSRAVLTVRTLAIGASAVLLPAVLLFPVAHVAPFVGAPRFMAIYPAILAFGLLVGALGVLITMSLVKSFGTQTAKVLAQVLGALVGALAFLLSQGFNFLSAPTRAAIKSWFAARTQTGELFATESPLWWPGLAFTGELLPLVTFVLASLVLFVATVQLVHRRFVSGAQESGTVKVSAPMPRVHAHRVAHHPLWVLVVIKEWRLILRDPQLISQTLLQLLYLLPLIVMALSGRWGANLLLPGFVLLTATLTGNLAWLTVAGEESPDLIGSSPLSLAKMRVYKAIAACAPPLALVTPVALYWLLARDPLAGFALTLCALGASVCVALCHLLNPRVADRKNMKSRQQYWVASLLEFATAFGWAGVAYGIVAQGWWIIAASSLAALAGVALSWVMGRTARAEAVLA